MSHISTPKLGIDMSPATWFVYVLECTTKSGRVTTHVGISLDVRRRVEDHRCGKVKATRGRSIELLGHSSALRHSDALRLEMDMKKLPAHEKRAWATMWAESTRPRSI